MARVPISALAMTAILLAACTSSGGVTAAVPGASASTPVPSDRPAATASEEVTASATPVASAPSAPSAPLARVDCARTSHTGGVAVAIGEYEFKPAAIQAAVDQPITFKNGGLEPHNATVDGGCATKTLATGKLDGLVFSTAGRYPFHCTVHPWMTGTITIGG